MYQPDIQEDRTIKEERNGTDQYDLKEYFTGDKGRIGTHGKTQCYQYIKQSRCIDIVYKMTTYCLSHME